ncbi:ribosome biogenesis GTPase [Clostridium tetanomorphum]|uniref:Small ribosomal subunit biogenesis GTPase RsgA n=1 Tax=Clostridium tetanomorphum TaxID=1553 RepID=A0A923E9B8_CLOTT|nr:ribosome small subunit-dependent GTPase A [Clostridium tetanomorphum]KAJ51511.1 GTPase RsgA [Clostridium tetanomorphum DSM 665]MBC2398863.1 ribosome small subunit-dependent GTPase A [Clostridium tetanomorphum]MBP1865159.1 ribosome biogenesis GTPase [Clostridium tetanomorphum]NRS84702.1 ribosome biogenesis GTPase [Clostridium tetanomorphum]NRZ97917.1 ribosome biogenesis GTPase [Clostridium tetanomorphum]
MQGIIIKGIGGFYYVMMEDKIIECKARGKFRHSELTPMVGDRVEINISGDKGTIDKIYERENMLIRPAVANVTQSLVVFALRNPDINEDLLNRFIMLCEYNRLKVVVCFNKTDLLKNPEEEEIVAMIKEAGYEVLFLNAKAGEGIDKIRERLKNNVTVLCGPSGVGKSTILNSLAKRNVMETGNISEKLKRGKHTTRHSELIEIEGGFLVDTPGFSSLNTDFIEKEKVQLCFPEFEDYLGQCKFTGCLHYKEPKCMVKEAMEEGKINKKRYDFYIKIIEEKIKGRNNR